MCRFQSEARCHLISVLFTEQSCISTLLFYCPFFKTAAAQHLQQNLIIICPSTESSRACVLLLISFLFTENKLRDETQVVHVSFAHMCSQLIFQNYFVVALGHGVHDGVYSHESASTQLLLQENSQSLNPCHRGIRGSYARQFERFSIEQELVASVAQVGNVLRVSLPTFVILKFWVEGKIIKGSVQLAHVITNWRWCLIVVVVDCRVHSLNFPCTVQNVERFESVQRSVRKFSLEHVDGNTALEYFGLAYLHIQHFSHVWPFVLFTDKQGLDHPMHLRRVVFGRFFIFALQNLQNQPVEIVRIEGLTKGSEFVEHDADSPDVTLVAIRFVIAQLRRHVVGCANRRLGKRAGCIEGL
mmetsp:Transcript_76206/g.123825  ORF Transcript_76206/g.123825 Transcript_76206/m.123825 type:complete len:357 (-) Transcript_76206:620-1690(-)